MLTFNKSGLLVPDNKISSTLKELEQEFVLNIPTAKRKEIFNAYIDYSEALRHVI